MSIRPLDPNRQRDPSGPLAPGPAVSSGPRFSEVLQAALLDRRPNKAGAVAAELIRLEVIGRALKLGDSSSEPGASRARAAGIGLLGWVPGSAPGSRSDSRPNAEPAREGGSGAARTLDDLIERAGRAHGVRPELLRAIVRAESDFQADAVSSAGAMGLMQLMPKTAESLGVTDPFDPEQNVMAGARFLRGLLDRYGDLETALAAYNWGPGNVERATGEPPRETREYVAKVKRFYREETG